MSQLSLFDDSFIPTTRPKGARKSRAQIAATYKRDQKPNSSRKTINILDSWQPEKQYYAIGEVAELFKVNASNIRFWTKEFNLKVRTTKKGDRLYNETAIYELSSIYRLVKDGGYTLAGARVKIKEDKNKAAATVQLKDSLRTLKAQLQQLRQQLA